MSARTWHLVCYDIRDDARLRHVRRLLEGYGERVQYSVFRCRLTPKEEQRLRWDLSRLAAKEDAWLVVPLCSRCVESLRRHDGHREWPEEAPSYIVV